MVLVLICDNSLEDEERLEGISSSAFSFYNFFSLLRI